MNKYNFSYSVGGYSFLFLTSLFLSQIAREYNNFGYSLLLIVLITLLIIIFALAISDNKDQLKAFYIGLFSLSMGVILAWSH